MQRNIFYRRFFLFTIVICLCSKVSTANNTMKEISFQMDDEKFIVYVQDEPELLWIKFDIKVNTEFYLYDTPDLSCTIRTPEYGLRKCSFFLNLKDNDLIYTYINFETFENDQVIAYQSKLWPLAVANLRDGKTVQYDKYIKVPQSSALNPFCYTSATVVNFNGDIRLCRHQLIFEDTFDELNTQVWTNEFRIPSTRVDSEFVTYNGSVTVNNGVLKISANISEYGIIDAYNFGARCTANSPNECIYEPKPFHYLPPITSGRINSAKNFNFRYGKIEVRAKVPKGDWLYPIIALEALPYAPLPSLIQEMRIAFVRGNQNLIWNNQNIDGTRLYGGPVLSLHANDRILKLANITLADTFKCQDVGVQKHFGDRFHVYSLTWKPNELILGIDGINYGRLDGRNFNYLSYISFGLAAGGHGDFPDNVGNKPWVNTEPKAIRNFNRKRQTWLSTWTQPSLEIDYVRVYAI